MAKFALRLRFFLMLRPLAERIAIAGYTRGFLVLDDRYRRMCLGIPDGSHSGSGLKTLFYVLMQKPPTLIWTF